MHDKTQDSQIILLPVGLYCTVSLQVIYLGCLIFQELGLLTISQLVKFTNRDLLNCIITHYVQSSELCILHVRVHGGSKFIFSCYVKFACTRPAEFTKIKTPQNIWRIQIFKVMPTGEPTIIHIHVVYQYLKATDCLAFPKFNESCKNFEWERKPSICYRRSVS